MGSEYDMSVGLNPQNAIKLQNYGLRGTWWNHQQSQKSEATIFAPRWN
ncbi:kynureninase [Aspergillus luchuensis]|uniref:Kynureninase n=1 Tax=Aspergillus kawachii TaxID=1069201 RepID=A0A146F471_ASPKA|nr:kynureninase [Aspergillus luchuensis]